MSPFQPELALSGCVLSGAWGKGAGIEIVNIVAGGPTAGATDCRVSEQEAIHRPGRQA